MLKEQPNTKKRPPLVLTSTAREQAQHHRLTQAIVMDVLRSRANAVKLDKGLMRFAGSDKHPQVHITAGLHPKTRQW
ncbi:MAG: hypothetical protein AAF125_28180 [Chloroflexota bacterium]